MQVDAAPQTFLWEIGCEDIPANMQDAARAQLATLGRSCLKDHGLVAQTLATFVAPKRLAIRLHHVTLAPVETQVRKGPLVALGEAAFEGFCRTAGVQAHECFQQDSPKGPVWHVKITPPTPSLDHALIAWCEDILARFSWPKTMRWIPGCTFAWVRPVRWMVALCEDRVLPWTWQPPRPHLQNNAPQDKQDPMSSTPQEGRQEDNAWTLSAGRRTQTHRLHPQGFIDIPHACAYEQTLLDGGVVVCPEQRRQRLCKGLEDALTRHGAISFSLRQQGMDALITENVGLTQDPQVLLGQFDASFLCLPEPVIATALHVHQKAFCVHDDQKKLQPVFAVITDGIDGSSGQLSPSGVRTGYERVVRARLSDALFFWKQDLETSLDDHRKPLAQRLFFQDLGSLWDKDMRTVALTQILVDLCWKTDLAEQACDSHDISAPSSFGMPSSSKQNDHRPFLAPSTRQWMQQVSLWMRADLSTAMVGEFPTLQGIMGSLYASAQGAPAPVAKALQDTYGIHTLRVSLSEISLPCDQNSLDAMPPQDKSGTASPSAQTCAGGPVCPLDERQGRIGMAAYAAVADGIDTLVGLFGVGRMPSGSKDPMALRRTAHGIIRACLVFGIDAPTEHLVRMAHQMYHRQGALIHVDPSSDLLRFFSERLRYVLKEDAGLDERILQAGLAWAHRDNLTSWVSQARACQLTHAVAARSGTFLTAYKRLWTLMQETDTQEIPLHFAQAMAHVHTLKDRLQQPQEQALLTILETVSVRLGDLVSVHHNGAHLQESPNAAHKSILGTPDLELWFQEMDIWPAPLHAFFDHVRVQDPDYGPARLALLRACVALFYPLGCLSALATSS